jgi:ABC-type Fe3+/spermidine/putrescine transport system ATPase subunit
MSSPLLTVSEIHTYYGDSYVLQGVSLTLRKGQIAAILGRNGMGKTTLIRSVAGLTPPRNGDIIYRDRSLRGWPPYAIAQAGIAIVPQGRRIFRSLTVRENLLMPTSALARSARASNGREQRWDFNEVLKEFPVFGILAVAPPPNYGLCSSVEPREFGGNLDNKEFLVGTSLYLPVFVPGANFSCGDGHAVQGDGEVCLTALETCLAGTFELVLHKKSLGMPRAVTPSHYITMGLDPDLDDAAKQALRDMIRWLVEMTGWSSEEAYVFCSLACDLRVTQLVDGNKGIHAMVARNLV